MRHRSGDGADGPDAVEVEWSGRSGSFDGNGTSSLDSWLVGPVGIDIMDHLSELGELMSWTEAGHLSWCVFPVDSDP